MGFRSAFFLGVVTLAAAAVSLAADDVEARKVGRSWSAAGAAAAAGKGQVIVVFRDSTREEGVDRLLRASGGVRGVRRSRSPRRVLAYLEPGVTVEQAVRKFSRMPEVLYAEPNGLLRASQAATLVPNDPRYAKFQWNMRQINAERTWGIQKGKASVAVAVLDTGVAYEDYFDPNTGQSFRKAPDWGDTVFLPGYDFVNNDDHANDDEAHGTHVASTIAEATNNGVGLAGLAFQCAIMPVKVLDQEGSGTFFDVAEGIDFAADFTQNGQHPVKVINMSLGGSSYSETVAASVDRAFARGVLLVAAAGNAASDRIDFPANLPHVVAVGATDATKGIAWYSNVGPELRFVAPGGDCDVDADGDGVDDCVWQQTLWWQDVQAGRYDSFCYCGISGTSMATPHVAAAAALLFSQGFTDPTSVRVALEQTAERLGGAPADGRNDTYGYGLVRPANALVGLGIGTGPKK